MLVALSSAVHRTLSATFRGIEEEMERLTDGDVRSTLALHVSSGYALLAELGRVAACPTSEPLAATDIAKTLRDGAAEAEARAARHGVRLLVEAPSELTVPTRPRAASLLVRTLLDHAIAASPRGTRVEISALAEAEGARVRVSDGGPVVPTAAHTDLLEYHVDPASFGRPPGPSLLVAHVVTAYLGGALRLDQSHSSAALVEALIPSTPTPSD